MDEMIKLLIEKSSRESDSSNAMRYAQAAVNAANALTQLSNLIPTWNEKLLKTE